MHWNDDWHSSIASLKSFFETDLGVALALSSFFVAYAATLVLAILRFSTSAKEFGTIRTEIEENVQKIKTQKNRGRQPTDPELTYFREQEKAVRADDYKIDETASRLMLPIMRAAVVGFLAAPVPLLFLLGNLGRFYTHFPATYSTLGLGGFTRSTFASSAMFALENVIRAIDLELADALHLAQHIYPAAMDVLALSILVWPLQVAAALYLFVSITQILILRNTIDSWTIARNDTATATSSWLRADGRDLLYWRVGTVRSAGFVATLFAPILTTFYRIRGWFDPREVKGLTDSEGRSGAVKWAGIATAAVWLIAVLTGIFLATYVGQGDQLSPHANSIARVTHNRPTKSKIDVALQQTVFVVHFAKNNWQTMYAADNSPQLHAASNFIEQNYPGLSGGSSNCDSIPVGIIRIVGESDRSTGTASYNIGLSRLRARAVEIELLTLGVPKCAITTEAEGDRNFSPEPSEVTAASHRRATINIEIRERPPTG